MLTSAPLVAVGEVVPPTFPNGVAVLEALGVVAYGVTGLAVVADACEAVAVAVAFTATLDAGVVVLSVG